jgi:hypothetical protein
MPILQEDMPYILARFKQMNAELAEQAAAHDATYVDIYTPSIGHDVCKLPGIAWVNGVVVVPPSYPAHPNQLGLLNAGRVVAEAIRDGSLGPEVVGSGAASEDPPTTSSTAGAGGSATLPATGGGPRSRLLVGLALVGLLLAARRLRPSSS